MRLCLKKGEEIPSQSTLVVSVPSIGNAGLMAVDCILSTVPFTRIGSIECSCLLSMTGYEKYNGMQVLCAPLEVYRLDGTNVIVFHQRSICAAGRTEEFIDEYKTLLEQLDLKLVMFIGSESMELMPEAQVYASKLFTYYQHNQPSQALDHVYKVCEASNLANLPLHSSPFYRSMAEYAQEETYHKDTYSQVFFVRNVLMKTLMENSILAGTFSWEQAKEEHGKSLALLVLRALGLVSEEKTEAYLRTPESWKHLFQELHSVPAYTDAFDFIY